MGRKEIEFEFEWATKNTYRVQEKSTGSPVIGTRFKGTEEGEGNRGMGVIWRRCTEKRLRRF